MGGGEEELKREESNLDQVGELTKKGSQREMCWYNREQR